jgi:hypothetical protein
MPQFRVLKRSTRERIYVDKINPREHLHITGVEFSSSQIADIERANGSNTFVKETKVEPNVVIEEVIAEAKVEEKKKGRSPKK